MNLVKEKWRKKDYQEFLNYLLSLRDLKYAEFTKKLITTKYQIIGVRLPLIRKIVENLKKGEIGEFLKLIGNNYYEEVLIEALVVASLNSFNEVLKFLPKIDNWGLCDTFCCSLKFIKINEQKYFYEILNLLKSKEEYIIRTGVVLFLNFYIKEEFLPKIFSEIDKVKIDKYYSNMAIAWFLAEAYISYPILTMNYLHISKINKFTFNKTISKIKDSYRVDDKMKAYLTSLKK